MNHDDIDLGWDIAEHFERLRKWILQRGRWGLRRSHPPYGVGDDVRGRVGGGWRRHLVFAKAARALFVVIAAVAVGVAWWRMLVEPPADERLFAQTAVLVRVAPSAESAVAEALRPGRAVHLGDAGERGWVEVFDADGGEELGYATDIENSFAPAPPPASAPSLPIDPSRSPVPDPARPSAPVAAICRDGWESHSKHRSGTCSSHGGVATWVNRPAS